MEKIVNAPIAGTFRWLQTGGIKIDVPEREDRKQFRLAAGESRTVILYDGGTPCSVEAELENDSSLDLILLPGRMPAGTDPVVNDIRVRLGENAQFHWYRLVRGRQETYDNCSAVLEGEGSIFTADVGYRMEESEIYDANCEAVHLGKKTRSRIAASGVLSGTSSKVFRGTIDFRKGSAGAVGNESEEVLMLDETVRNRSVPVILCSEEDVEGTHGATVGRPDEKMVHYLASRGLDEESIYEMLAQAKLNAVISRIPDAAVRESLLQDEEITKEG